MKIIDGIAIFGDPDIKTLGQMRRVALTGPVVGAALMADNHYGYSMPIGGVVAYDDAVSPSGVGYDISCGIKATKTNLNIRDLAHQEPGLIWTTQDVLNHFADTIAAEVAFGVGQTAAVKVDHELFDDPLWYEPELENLKNLAYAQLGTVGSGNHFVDLLTDQHGWLWIMVHFGSRGFGHKVASGFLNLAAGRTFDAKAPGENMDNPPVILKLNDLIGQYYWNAMTLAGRYAYAGRDAVVNQVLGILGASETYSVHNHHNYAWKEVHDGKNLIVVRKGATPAFPGQMGAVGGSMGDPSVLIHGVDSKQSRLAFYSAMHGAGRVMSRTQAAGKVKWLRDTVTGRKAPRRVTEGAITKVMMHDWINEQDVILRGAGTDEAPQAYRRLTSVVQEHEGTIVVNEWLKPVVVVMAGAEVFDPYKD